jgi:hypothetical protein
MLLFGGKREKDYKWITSFLGLMHTISLKGKNGVSDSRLEQETQNKELVMTQYMVKLLTILSNILISNLLILQADGASQFVL